MELMSKGKNTAPAVLLLPGDGREPEEIRQKVDRELQPTGIILDDPEIQEAAKPMKISRKSDTNDTVSARTAEEIQELCDRTLSVIRLNADRIRSGEAAPRPVQDGAGSPCEQCDHETACSYDKSLPGCAIPVIDHKRRTDTCPAEPKTV